MSDLKTQICDALAAWIRQPPHLVRAEARDIARDKRDAETLLAAVRGRDSITAEMLLESAKKSFSGALEFVPGTADEPAVVINYRTDQHRPAEYRKAAAAVLADALWEHMRDAMPKPDTKADTDVARHIDTVDGVSVGEWLRNRFRKEFGSKLQRRWFN